MQTALSRPASQRWLVAIVPGIIVPLLFAALPGQPVQTLATKASMVKEVRAEIATLHSVRTGFQQARKAERDLLAGRSLQSHALEISRITQALDRVSRKYGPAGANLTAVRDAIAAYAQAFNRVAAAGHDVEPAMQPLPVNAIESVLGRLQSKDEAGLREPLLAMQSAEAAWTSEADPRAAGQISQWSRIFSARLEGMMIPQGTRANLQASLAGYEHAILSPHGGLVRQQSGGGLQAAARLAEAALADADHVLAAEQQRLNETFRLACKQLVWTFGAALTAALCIVGLGAFGRRAFWHGLAPTRHAR